MINCYHTCNCFPDLKDWLILFIGSVISVTIPFLLYTLKPKLEIKEPEIDENEKCIKFKLKNISSQYKAINLKIEASIKEPTQGGKWYTYRLEFDRKDFLILSQNKIRTFVSQEITTATLDAIKRKNPNVESQTEKDTFINLLEKIKNNSDMEFRVGVYAQNEYSGFGRAFESSFRWNATKNKFEKI